MAGDWIKMRVDLLDDTDVEQMSDILDIDVPTTVGHLFAFWCYADKNTTNGKLNSTDRTIDKKTCDGFSKALRSVKWLNGRDRNLDIPNFARHNGDSAKARGLEAEAKRLRRSTAKDTSPSPSESDKMSDISSDTCPTKREGNVRPEKRREEKSKKTTSSTPIVPKGTEKVDGEIKLRLNKLFNRRETTKWSAKETSAFKKIEFIEDEIQLVEMFHDPVKGSPYKRQDLQTLLNNWNGEVDKARAHKPIVAVNHAGGRKGKAHTLDDIQGDFDAMGNPVEGSAA